MGKSAKRGRIVMLLSNPGTNDERPLKEARSLTKGGFDVTILAWDREGAAKSDTFLQEGVVIKRMRLYAGHGTPVRTVPKLLIFYAWCLGHLLFRSVDAIHCHDVDTLPAGFAVKVLKLGRPRLVYDMHDLPQAFLRFFPLSRVAEKVFLASSRVLADFVIVVNDRFVDHLGRLGFRRDRMVVVMNSPPAEGGTRRARRPGTFRVLYFGGLSEERGVRLLVDAVEGLDGVTLSLAGRGELEGWVKERAKRNPQVRFLGWLSMADLSPEIREADLIPSLYEPRTKNAQLATPGKLFTSMSQGIPVLVPSGSYQAEIVKRLDCGVVIDWGDVQQAKGAIQRLSTDRVRYDALAKAAYDGFRSSFSWEVMENRLVSAYTGALQSRGGAQPTGTK